jgi:hypothetical protein
MRRIACPRRRDELPIQHAAVQWVHYQRCDAHIAEVVDEYAVPLKQTAVRARRLVGDRSLQMDPHRAAVVQGCASPRSQAAGPVSEVPLPCSSRHHTPEDGVFRRVRARVPSVISTHAVHGLSRAALTVDAPRTRSTASTSISKATGAESSSVIGTLSTCCTAVQS